MNNCGGNFMSQNELSSLSYTNKDFNSIYSELLDYAKKISYRWDPSSSDESDPGVVLLKLAALVADKNNYNIDTSILELMPASVTQLPAARKLFDQCGYAMRYFRSAEGILTLTVRKHPDLTDEESGSVNINDAIYEIPQFTMFTDIDSSVVYSTKQKVSLTDARQSVDVIQGIATKYKLSNNETTITPANLDSKNRLYFNDINISENGIFICNVGTENYDEWERTDNLETYPRGNRCYKFGIMSDTSSCYIEFPDDAYDIFGAGINITYMRTDGIDGNIGAKKIVNFYSPTKFTRKLGSLETLVDVTTENITITNPFPFIDGANPETIDEAYKSYKRVKDTFDTLVTLKDYSDYIVTEDLASNGFVCDRTNDIQHVYNILKIYDTENVLTTHVEVQVDQVDVNSGDNNTTYQVESPKMSAFDLSVYAFKYRPNPTTYQQFKESFELDERVAEELNNCDVKSLQHDFKSFEEEKILLIKNKYALSAHVIPRNVLSEVERLEVRDNISKALYLALNSRQMSFGEEVPYDLIYETINNADPRIKAASVAYPEFETYAVYKQSGVIKELRIDSKAEPSSDKAQEDLRKTFQAEIFAKNILCGTTPLYAFDETFNYSVSQTDIVTYEEVSTIQTDFTTTSEVKEGSKHEFPTLRSNENILLTAPNFIEETNYSSYVKVLYSFSQDVPAGSKYELRDDDYLALFWKSVDSNDYYDYVIYDNGSTSKIICPSMKMFAKQYGNTPTFTDDQRRNFITSLKFGNKLGSGSNITIGGTISGYEYISELSQTKYHEVLTGTEVIHIYKPNSVVINEDSAQGCNDVYWVTNRKNTDDQNTPKYYLRWEKVSDTTKYRYTLKSGEYFIYTNKSRSVIHILGEGTLLECDKNLNSDSIWTVEAIDYSTILLEGIDALDGLWHTIPYATSETTNYLKVTEQEQHLLGPGSTLYVEETSESMITLSSAKETPLNNATIKYTTADNSEPTELEKIFVSGASGWVAKTILNINATPDSPQKLLSNQSIIIINNNSENPITGNNESPVFIQPSIAIHNVGGVVDVRAYSIQDETYKNITVSKYKKVNDVEGYIANGENTKTIVNYLDSEFAVKIVPDLDADGNIGYYDNDGNFQKSINFSTFTVKPGKYLIQLNSVAKFDSLLLNSSKEEPSTVSFEYAWESTSNCQYTYLLTNSGVSPANVKLTLKGKTSDVKIIPEIIVQPMLKYDGFVLNDSDDLLTKIKDRVHELDPNEIFDYSYINENAIDNPLDSASFHNSDHFFNKFTIDEWTDNLSSKDQIFITKNVR